MIAGTMTIYQPRPGIYSFKHLPHFARHLLQNHLDEYVSDNFEMIRSLGLPLAKQLAHLSDEQVLAFGRKATHEYLTLLSENRAHDYIVASMERWKNDQLQIVGRLDLAAEDVTGFNFIRSRLFRKWVRVYDIPLDEKYELIDEIEILLFGATTTALNIFIDLLKTNLQKESHLSEKLIKELQRSNESLQQFASVASHDLKEPLRKMSMYTDMVLTTEPLISEHSQSSLAKVKMSAIRMQSMIEDILNFSSITNNEEKQKVSLEVILSDVKEILEESIRQKNASIVTDGLPEIPVFRSQIRQLFQNLISNAVKFSRPDATPVVEFTHGHVTGDELEALNLDPAKKYLKITVTDNGIGFKQEHAERIFALFTRLHARANYEGSGLGLSICKRIVENHEGVISAQSTPGEGAKFTIVIPRQ
jgi:signal transduction histidine kinase